ncbi:hypothetical protein INT44_002280 [Umbelopsis vinacea]|uniref:C2 domain-containing protein n=1 Tax=Umbelopsis vinacea TaxID=44442 RepID=A0A8H7Q301_9FUNG|nr:hypothetical protein INT44_002280 [Umbelopsis vinacea]
MQTRKLVVNCARGLAETGVFDRMDPFIGCYIVPSEKHRTQNHKDGGSEPHWNETLYLDVPVGENRLYVEVFDEDPRSAGIIGGVAIELSEITNSGRLDKWFAIRKSNGNQSGEIHLVLNIEGSPAHAGYAPPPPSFENQQYQTAPPHYNGPALGYPQEKSPSYGLPPSYDGPSTGYPGEKQYDHLGPQVPMPLSYGSGNPPPFSPPPPQQYNTPTFPPQSSNSPYSYGGQSPSQGSSGGYNSPYTPGMTSQSPYTNSAEAYQSADAKSSAGKQPGKPTPDWMKMGGAALAGAAAVGLGAWMVDEVKDHNEHKHDQHHHGKKHNQHGHHH